jgi:hypothetical protein
MVDADVDAYRKLKEITDTALQVAIVEALILESLLREGRSEAEVKAKLRETDPTHLMPSKTDLLTQETFQAFIEARAHEIQGKISD